jgi:transposase
VERFLIYPGHETHRKTVGGSLFTHSRTSTQTGRTRSTLARQQRSLGWDSLGPEDRRAVGRIARPVSSVPDLPPAIPTVVQRRNDRKGTAGDRRGLEGKRQTGSQRGVYRRLLRGGQKRGPCVGKTKRGKGTKIMAIADGSGLPIAIGIESASPHEVKLVEATLDNRFIAEHPSRVIGDKAYDSNALDERLLKERGTEMIAPNRRRSRRSQDGRPLRRYKRRWKVERLFAWLQNYRRIQTRWERHAHNYLGFVHLGCIVILLRYL